MALCKEYPTLLDEAEVQQSIQQLYESLPDLETVRVERRKHIAFLEKGLGRLASAYTSLDASRPWLCYWVLHALDLLHYPFTDTLRARTIATLALCQHPKGGFGGGPGQLPHLMCTFAAVSALAIVGTAAAYESINRSGLAEFLERMKQPDGSFTAHDDGEIDVRGSYCAIVAASLAGILTPKLTANVAPFIKTCQSYEGGFGALPLAEAQGGYTYCAFATLAILEDVEGVDLHALNRFAVMSQCPITGGFRGRTHKLVDGCYSFWTGALFPLMRRFCPAPYFDSLSLQKFILVGCQNEVTGGLRDKPEKSEDYYHTCYCLSGLSLAQRESPDLTENVDGGIVLGDCDNLLPSIMPEYNLLPSRVHSIIQYWTQ
jgi:protein farnesyltransferase subunit beta